MVTSAELGAVPLFDGLDDEVLSTLASRFVVERHERGSVVVAEGEDARAFYVLASGRVTVTAGGRRVGDLGQGDFFGEIAVLGAGARTATVTAVEPVVVWALPTDAFRSLTMSRPAVALALRGVMTERLGQV